jgi:hypothetical protein
MEHRIIQGNKSKPNRHSISDGKTRSHALYRSDCDAGVMAAWYLCSEFDYANYVLRSTLADKFIVPICSTINAASTVMSYWF